VLKPHFSQRTEKLEAWRKRCEEYTREGMAWVPMISAKCKRNPPAIFDAWDPENILHPAYRRWE
jgi:hypothetical protein